MKKPVFPTVDEITALFVCDPITGAILDRKTMLDATYPHGSGYRKVCVRGYGFFAHRVMWVFMCGAEPPLLDHINGVRDDNRIANLRVADAAQNAHNKRVNRTSKSGIKGINYDQSRNKWRARIRIEGRNITLGRFESAEAAGNAYRETALAYRGEFART